MAAATPGRILEAGYRAGVQIIRAGARILRPIERGGPPRAERAVGSKRIVSLPIAFLSTLSSENRCQNPDNSDEDSDDCNHHSPNSNSYRFALRRACLVHDLNSAVREVYCSSVVSNGAIFPAHGRRSSLACNAVFFLRPIQPVASGASISLGVKLLQNPAQTPNDE